MKQYQDIEKDLVNYMPSIPLWYYKINAGYSQTVPDVTYNQLRRPGPDGRPGSQEVVITEA